MKYVKLFFASAACFILSSNALATDWQYVSKSADARLFVDFDSIRDEGNIRKAWVLVDMDHETIANGKKFASWIQMQYFNCAADTYSSARFLTYSGHGGKGDVVHSSSQKFNASEMVDIVPDSLVAGSAAVVCGTTTAREQIRKANKSDPDRQL